MRHGQPTTLVAGSAIAPVSLLCGDYTAISTLAFALAAAAR